MKDEIEKDTSIEELKEKQKTEKLRRVISVQSVLLDVINDTLNEGGED